MIYICGKPSAQVPITNAFMVKGLSDYTVGNPSSISIVAKPTYPQIAYSGYKENIEAFLGATAVKSKVLCTCETFPIPEDYEPSVPLPYPRLVFQVSGKPSPEMLRKMQDKLAEQDIRKVDFGKGNAIFALNTPSYTTLFKDLPRISQPRCGALQGYAQIISIPAMKKVYQCIDLFLATNTYSFKKAEYPNRAADSKGLARHAEYRVYQGAFYRDGFGGPTSKKMKAVDATTQRFVDLQEQIDLTPDCDTTMKPDSAVIVAKPSPLPSSTSWGSPSSVPFSPGLLFPYFDGLLNPDTKFVRSMVAKHFFRNLAETRDQNAKAAFVDFRENCGTAVTTPQGQILCHVLFAIDMALETQTQAYLLFDGKTYLGFCLLGEEFSINIHGKWNSPLSAEALREELASIKTHEAVLDDICILLGSLKDSGGDAIQVTPEDIQTSNELADCLASIDLDESPEEGVAQLEKLMGLLRFETSFRPFQKGQIVKAIDMLFGDEELPKDIPIYLPTKSKLWGVIGSRVYKVLASFGSRSFHFRNAKGDEITIPRDADAEDSFEELIDGKAHKWNRMIVYEADIFQATSKWEEMVREGKIKLDNRERAIGARGYVFPRKGGCEEIWAALKRGGPKLKGKKRQADDAGESEKKRRRKAIVVGDVSAIMSSLFD